MTIGMQNDSDAKARLRYPLPLGSFLHLEGYVDSPGGWIACRVWGSQVGGVCCWEKRIMWTNAN
jgi:hypothetical protein